MGKLTADKPKGAIEVGGHALIDWQIEALRAAGVKDIAVVTGHGAAALAGRDVEYIHNANWATGTQVETLLAAADWIGEEPVIVSYSDIIYHPCAPLALLERPGDIVVTYDADHRWLWKRRFGNWLKDSETFRLGPGQVLTEIGGKPTDIEELDGQFMGLMLLTLSGLEQFAQHFRAKSPAARAKLDFTALLAALLVDGARIDTAANALPWMEIDSAKDLKIARSMTEKDEIKGTVPHLIFPPVLSTDFVADASDDQAALTESAGDDGTPAQQESESWDEEHLRPYLAVRDHVVENAFAVQNWGRSGSTFVQSLFDDHPQVLSTPNFYSRAFYETWAATLVLVPDQEKARVFLQEFRHWWDPNAVDRVAGLHRLGPDENSVAGVPRGALEHHLRAALPKGRSITRRALFEAAHLAYARARGQHLSESGIKVLFPIHGEPRSVAAAVLEDYPEAKFVHTMREPVSNFLSACRYIQSSSMDERVFPLLGAASILFDRKGTRYDRDITLFGDRPYFHWLQCQGQVCYVRLEDFNSRLLEMTGKLASWIGISNSPTLRESTFDGLKWGNRSDVAGTIIEAPATPSAGAIDYATFRIASPHLSRIVTALSSRSPLVAAIYSTALNKWDIGILLTFAEALVVPWRVRFSAQTSTMQRLVAVRRCDLLLTKSWRNWLYDRIERERYRARLLEHGASAASVRVRQGLPCGASVSAVIIITGGSPKWRLQAMSRSSTAGRNQSDRLTAFFLDEAVARPSIRRHFVLGGTLTLGALVARCMISLMLRGIVARALSKPRADLKSPLTLLEPPSRVDY